MSTPPPQTQPPGGLSYRLSIRNLRLDIDPDGDDPVSLHLDALDLAPGETCILYGKSGIGKTTLLEVLAGLRAPNAAGHITLTDLAGQSWDMAGLYGDAALADLVALRAGPVGYVPQGGAVLPFLNARQNVLLGAGEPAQASNRLQGRLLALSAALDMDAHLGKLRAALSGGQRKRVALMRGLIQPRALLLLDEPTAGLDNAMADHALSVILEQVRRDGSAAIIVMHDIDRAVGLGLQPFELLREANSARVSLAHMARGAA